MMTTVDEISSNIAGTITLRYNRYEVRAVSSRSDSVVDLSRYHCSISLESASDHVDVRSS